MLIVQPDFDRHIDLPGVGPCRRPVDIDRTSAPLKQLVSLRVYAFAAGMEIGGEAEEDEVFLVLMRGAADITVTQNSRRFGPFALRSDGERAVYLPPHAAYRLEAIKGSDIAYARGVPAGSRLPEPAVFRGPTVADHATSMTLALVSEDVRLPGTPERLVHLRSDDGGGASLGGEPLGDWMSAVVAAGEPALLTISEGTVDILTVSVAQR